MSAQGVIILLVLMLLVSVPLAAFLGKRQGQKAPLPPPHQHAWLKWEAATLNRTMYGRKVDEVTGQTRICDTCGKREIREVKA